VHDPLGTIAAVDAADALVDVVGKNAKTHIPIMGSRRQESSGLKGGTPRVFDGRVYGCITSPRPSRTQGVPPTKFRCCGWDG
jgi:hypothetical protein